MTSKHVGDFLRIFFLLIMVLLTFTWLFSHYEKVSFFRAFYWAVTTASTVGYGDVVPTNHAGRLIAIGLMLIGVGILGLFLALMSAAISDFRIRRMFGMIESHLLNDHIVIIGYSRFIQSCIKEILDAKENVTLVADLDKAPFDCSNLVFIKGSVTDETTLAKAHIEKAKLCIISDEDDSNSLIAGVNIRINYKNTYITALIYKKEIEKALKEIGINEVFSSSSFSSRVLLKSIQFKGASKFFSQLFDEKFQEGLLEKDLPSNIESREFWVVMQYFKDKHDELVIGIKRGAEMIVNPAKTFVVSTGDKIILIGKK